MGCNHSRKATFKSISAQNLQTPDKKDKKEEKVKTPILNMKMVVGTVASNPDQLLPEMYESLLKMESIQSSIALSKSVFAVLEKCRELVMITDNNNCIQYVNTPMARVLSHTPSELTGQIATVFQEHSDLQPAIRTLERGFEWVGRIRWRTKSGDSVSLQCRSMPISPAPSYPTYYLYLLDSPSDCHFPRGSVPSLRKGSYDLKSIISEGSARRQSLAKLHNLPLEAPITKVLSLLCAAQENAPPNVIGMLEEVMDLLRTTELYTSHLKTDNLRAEDPLTTNLIAALVAKGPPSSIMPRRSSAESPTKKKLMYKKNTNVVLPASKELKEAMKKINTWEFDVILVEKLTSGKPLVYVGIKIFSIFNAYKVLGVDEKTLYSWLVLMVNHYIPDNSYHNSTHAADVLQAAACFLLKLRSKKLLEPLDEICCLIAAVAHDLGHPGKSSAFLTNAGDDLALLYNDISVLEQHHASLTFRLTLADDRVNILRGLEQSKYSTARSCIIDTILATDMYKHFEHFTKFVTIYSKSSEDVPEKNEKPGESEVDVNPEDVVVVKRMLIKCSDVANPTRPLQLCKHWAKRIAEEYFTQTDEEKERNLPVVMPLFDRSTCSIPISQMGFMDYIVNNMFEEWDAFLEMPETLYNLRKNYDYWKDLNDKGCVGIEEETNGKKEVQDSAQI
uniref:3',5'-cyclic-AMP phosphodiesterase n=1 Tax=Lygus hesperus TaxID=30085 RepID=A0A0K8SGT4_LYGHE